MGTSSRSSKSYSGRVAACDRVLLGHVLAEFGHRVPAHHLGPAAAHGLQRLGQHHLEVGELVVDVVVGVLADPARLLQGGAADALGLAPHLGAREHAAALAPGRLDVLGGVPPGLGYHLFALGHEAPGIGQLLGHPGGELVQDLQDLGAVDHARGGHRNRLGGLDDLHEVSDHLLQAVACGHFSLAPLAAREGRPFLATVGLRGPRARAPSAKGYADFFFRSASRSVRAERTRSGTRPETSPPSEATSLSSDEDR